MMEANSIFTSWHVVYLEMQPHVESHSQHSYRNNILLLRLNGDLLISNHPKQDPSLEGPSHYLVCLGSNDAWKVAYQTRLQFESLRSQRSFPGRRYDLLPWLGLKLQMQLSEEQGQSQVMVDSDLKVSSLPPVSPEHHRDH